MAKERLQKILSQGGIASRRRAEDMIREGRVTVNGTVASIGMQADPTKDEVAVDGTAVSRESRRYYLFNKPRGVVTTMHDPEGRSKVADYAVDLPVRVRPVGRLDINTGGALLLTNDGELAHRLLQAQRKVMKVYRVKINGILEVRQIERLMAGVRLDDGKVTAPAQLIVLSEDSATSLIQLTLHQGMNHQVHRMMESVGLKVMRLIRTSFAGLTVETLRSGKLRELRAAEVRRLKRLVE